MNDNSDEKYISERESYMEKEIGFDSSIDYSNRDYDIELESINDIIERIEGLSYEGRRHIIAYLKAKMAKRKKDK